MEGPEWTAESRPELTPLAVLLRRGPDRLQVGVDGRTALLVHDPGNGLQEWLQRCDGTRTWEELSGPSAPTGYGPAELHGLLASLLAAGLVAWTPRLARRPLVRLLGAGPLGAAIGRLLLQTGSVDLYVVDEAPPDPDLHPLTSAGTQAEAFRVAVAAERSAVEHGGRSRSARGPADHRAGGPTGGGSAHGTRPGTVSVGRHWSKPDGTPVALTILATGTAEPDRSVAEGLVRTDQPHLVARSRPGGASVGPVVVPGRTSCLRCADLTRRDGDPEWPELLRQLTSLRPPADPVATTWAAAVTAAQALGVLAGASVETLSSTVELTAADGRTQWRAWPRHPACGCHW